MSRHSSSSFTRCRGAAAAAALAILLVASGCIDPIDLNRDFEERRLVVEGQVIEGPGPHEVILSRSAAFSEGLAGLRRREQGAHVAIVAGDGGEYVLEEVAAGHYFLEEGILVAEPGTAYFLRIVVADGTVYESTPETMLEGSAVESLRASKVFVNNRPHLELEATGRVHWARKHNFFRWTWHGGRGFDGFVDAEGNAIGEDVCPPDTIVAPVRNTSALHIADNSITPMPRVRMPSVPVNSHMDIAMGRGTFIVYLQQQALTPDAYAYFSQIRQMTENPGSLFDPPAVTLTGNVTRADDRAVRALGYFVVAGATTVRMCCRWGACQDADAPPPEPDPCQVMECV